MGRISCDLTETVPAAHSGTTGADTASSDGHARGLKSGIHGARSTSHLHAMPADTVAAVLHRRMHVSLDHLKRLGARSADAPKHVAAATNLTCVTCAEANAVNLPHGSSRYQPSHAGRLVHADIVGPFTSSMFGGTNTHCCWSTITRASSSSIFYTLSPTRPSTCAVS